MPRLLDNTAYYQSNIGHEIMSTHNFDDHIIRYLAHEQAFISGILANQSYTTLIEIGCDKVRSFETAAMNNVKYIGIDIRTKLEEQSKHYFSQCHKSTASFLRGSLVDIDGVLNDKVNHSERILCLFPFNLIGNVENITNILRKYYMTGMDIVISSFQTGEPANSIRRAYYQKCGLDIAQEVDDVNHYTFCCNDFQSSSYSCDYIQTVAGQVGFSVEKTFSTNVFYLFHMVRLLQ
ncbi:hypothetical protein KCM76_18015 [Zooshikella marina]|uniref:Class I SAM-dependent methyltransferase n=1 Tax=Zooshikella ganghwensis TaxID=202772 RepID=A0A4P9VKP4_9GAMM|nr:hypothetical protein [Zooshikella ganghwensis]MBU2707896.1 hypothetical protein [Zooshikella ganghwensis]RDH43813.1 hypothetical protein B9G39_10365 [Zooshikella ganghwensis]